MTDLFWLFFIFSALQPVLRQRMLDAMRMRKIAPLERTRNSRVMLLVHRQETMRLVGFPLVRYIDVNDSEQVRRDSDDRPGRAARPHPAHAWRARARCFPDRPRSPRPQGQVTAFVPYCAMSDGTLIALAADQIRDEQARGAGPRRPAARPSPRGLADQGRRAEADRRGRRRDPDHGGRRPQGDRAGQADRPRSARAQLPPEQAEALAEKLSTGTWTHDYPILPQEAQAFASRSAPR